MKTKKLKQQLHRRYTAAIKSGWVFKETHKKIKGISYNTGYIAIKGESEVTKPFFHLLLTEIGF